MDVDCRGKDGWMKGWQRGQEIWRKMEQRYSYLWLENSFEKEVCS